MTRFRSPSLLSAMVALATFAAPAAARAQDLAVTDIRPGKAKVTSSAARRYGAPTALGEGTVRTYVLMNDRGDTPVEIGVALDERALDGLPTRGSGHHGGHEMPHTFLLDLPADAVAPFRFVELNWNPNGHEPDGVYQDVPHFDFHFYTISKAERETIVPSDPSFTDRANDIPTGDYVPEFNAALGPPGAKPAAIAVPMMGVHWVDVRSAGLQKLLGKPDAWQPFTATFIHGSWACRYIFWEPMITRAHIVAKKTTSDESVRDQLIPIPTPKRYHVPGYYPNAYRITWDPQAREYRIALTGLAKKD